MHDVAKQLALSWARKGPRHRIDASGDFTRLTLDTIALCAMDYRFNSFYQERQHPFVEAMNTTLGGAAKRTGQIPFISSIMDNGAAEIAEAQKTQYKIAMEIVEDRRKHPSSKKDLLNAMINGVDPKTGNKMSDALIGSNMITFLVAGKCWNRPFAV